jgi:hypothetical protein
MDPETSSDFSSPKSIIEPFPKSRLYPEQWDLSELLAKAPPAEAPTASFSGYEPFPKLRTLPGEWDLE